MKSFQQIQEERGEKAFKQAIAMGLKYSGFGYWKDPQTGETKFKTENDTLVPVEQDEASELYKGDGPGGKMGTPAGSGMPGMGGGMMGAGGMLQMPGQGGTPPGGGSLGAGEPGKEQVEKDHSWEPGPDGDTCVGPEAEKPGQIPQDSYVGRTNFLKWQAGPDGDNMTTVSYEKIMEAAEETYTPPNAGTLMRQAMGAQKRPATDAPFGRTIKQARSAVDKMKKGGHDVVLGNQIADMMKINRRNKERTYDDTIQDSEGRERLERGKQIAMHKKLVKLPAVAKDAEAVKQMNTEAKGLVKDPNYKMDQYDDDIDYMDEGAFGQVFEDKNGNVVKKGELGPGELKALYAMRNNPAFPDLINAEFDEPFKHKSSVYNNPMNADNERRGGGGLRPGEDYWDPDEQSEWDKQFPTAMGTYAMSQAKGGPLFDEMGSMDDDMRDKMMRNFWRARGDLHKAGFSHNDMHGGNIFVDPETGEVNIIDLGLAKDNKLSALMEGLGGMDFEQGEDYQLSGEVSGANFSERMQEMSAKNRANIEQDIMDNIEFDVDSDEFDNAARELAGMLQGGIRMKEVEFDNIKEAIPYLADDKNVEKLIKMLYEEVGNSELADRMSDAFDRKQLDTKVIRAADQVRKRQGLKPIEVKNKNVIPPKNMDFDD